MALPSDFEEDYDCGLRVDLIQETELDSYSSYCPYFDEQIFFHRENLDGYPPSDTAQFLIIWKKDGTPKVVKWWIEEEERG